MAANVGDWIGELTTTTGTGDIALGGQLVGHAPFSSIGDGEVWYAIVDGLDRESGLGVLSGSTLQRTTVYSTLIDGVFSNSGYPISLSGKADVYCTFNKAAYDQIIDAFNKIIEGNPGFQEAFEVPFAPGNGIEATDVQAAIDEVNSDVLSNDSDILDLQNNKLDVSAAVTEINDLSDVDTTGKVEGRILKFDASGNLIVGNSSDEVLNQAMTKEDFDALAEKRIRDNAGSGFAEWGKHIVNSNDWASVNQGLACGTGNNGSRPLYWGREGASTSEGISRTENPIANINGIHQKIAGTSDRTDGVLQNEILFPPAPDGTKTYDSATGTVVQHADSATAFASETGTNKVITSRQDYVFIESWHEEIAEKDVVYPLGNVQYGATTWNGIPTSSSLVAQGYSAFGEWDSTTLGYAAKWSTLSDAHKAAFLQDPSNNIYNDNGKLIQVRYRVRVIEGLGDDWHLTSPQTGDNTYGLSYAYAADRLVKPQGVLVNSQDFIGSGFVATDGRYGAINSPTETLGDRGLGHFTLDTIGSSQATDTLATIAHNGLCFAVPIALVQRRNQGAYHTVYNPNGTAKFGDGNPWYSTTDASDSTLDCFTSVGDGSISGANSGRSDGKFYDAIYASDVNDLRMSSRRVPLAQIREGYKRKAIAGEVRGFEGVPFTKVYLETQTSEASGTNGVLVNNGLDKYAIGDMCYLLSTSKDQILRVQISNVTDTVLNWDASIWGTFHREIGDMYIFNEKAQQHSQSNPTWTDIIGDPANIAATFPNGVEGQWIPVIPDSLKEFDEFPLNRKLIDLEGCELISAGAWQENSGWSSWLNFNETTNTPSSSSGIFSASWVQLVHYETQAHFTQDDVNSTVLDLGEVRASSHYTVDTGVVLNSSLIGKVSTSPVLLRIQELSLIDRSLQSPMKLPTSTSWAPITHSGFDIIGDASPAVKTLDYLSSENGVAKLVYAYKEMVYDSTPAVDITMATAMNANSVGETVRMVGGELAGVYNFRTGYSTGPYQQFYDAGQIALNAKGDIVQTSDGGILLSKLDSTAGNWGDNNQFEINNNQATITDNNGNTVLYGTASFDTQYFIEYSDIPLEISHYSDGEEDE